MPLPARWMTMNMLYREAPPAGGKSYCWRTTWQLGGTLVSPINSDVLMQRYINNSLKPALQLLIAGDMVCGSASYFGMWNGNRFANFYGGSVGFGQFGTTALPPVSVAVCKTVTGVPDVDHRAYFTVCGFPKTYASDSRLNVIGQTALNLWTSLILLGMTEHGIGATLCVRSIKNTQFYVVNTIAAREILSWKERHRHPIGHTYHPWVPTPFQSRTLT